MTARRNAYNSAYHIRYAGRTNLDLGLAIATRPSIRAAEEAVSVRELPGRRAPLTERSGQYGSVAVDVVFNYLRPPELWAAAYRAARLWLRQEGELWLSDDPEIFRRVLYVAIGENARILARIGRFTASFVCAPGEYLSQGRQWLTLRGGVLRNEYSAAYPQYELTGRGTVTLAVNGQKMTVELSDVSILDTELQLAYPAEDPSGRTRVKGDYEALALLPGDNTVEISGGASLRVRPNWVVL